MTEQNQELAIAEARLMIAACAHVDAAGGDIWSYRATREELKIAVADYRAALRGSTLLADHPLVAQGMAVVRRLLE